MDIVDRDTIFEVGSSHIHYHMIIFLREAIQSVSYSVRLIDGIANSRQFINNGFYFQEIIRDCEITFFECFRVDASTQLYELVKVKQTAVQYLSRQCEMYEDRPLGTRDALWGLCESNWASFGIDDCSPSSLKRFCQSISFQHLGWTSMSQVWIHHRIPLNHDLRTTVQTVNARENNYDDWV